jgi:hypothetical protein
MNETSSKEKLEGLGYETMVVSKKQEIMKEVVTWNLYGAVKDYEKIHR